MGGMLSRPLRSQFLQRRTDGSLRLATCSMQGYRESMEDAHSFALRLKNHPDTSFFAVFDGHSGTKASLFLEARLREAVDALAEINEATLLDAVVTLDKEYCEGVRARNWEDSGSTCVFGVLKWFPTPRTADDGRVQVGDLLVGNVGDSRILVGRPGSLQVSQRDYYESRKSENPPVPEVVAQATESSPLLVAPAFPDVYLGATTLPGEFHMDAMTEDHKPDLPQERARIVAAGGHVAAGRVDSCLAMSRAFGDYVYKHTDGKPWDEQKVICIPEFDSKPIYQGDWILIACDGLFEAMTNLQVATCVQQDLYQHDEPGHALSTLLFDSLVEGSKDNMSAILVQITPGRADDEDHDSFQAGAIHEGWECDATFLREYLQFGGRHGLDDGPMVRRLALEDAVRGRPNIDRRCALLVALGELEDHAMTLEQMAQIANAIMRKPAVKRAHVQFLRDSGCATFADVMTLVLGPADPDPLVAGPKLAEACAAAAPYPSGPVASATSLPEPEELKGTDALLVLRYMALSSRAASFALTRSGAARAPRFDFGAWKSQFFGDIVAATGNSRTKLDEVFTSLGATSRRSLLLSETSTWLAALEQHGVVNAQGVVNGLVRSTDALATQSPNWSFVKLNRPEGPDPDDYWVYCDINLAYWNLSLERGLPKRADLDGTAVPPAAADVARAEGAVEPATSDSALLEMAERVAASSELTTPSGGASGTAAGKSDVSSSPAADGPSAEGVLAGEGPMEIVSEN